METIVAAALVTVLAAGVYTVYQPTAGLAQVQTQTALLDQLKTGVERSFGSSSSYIGVSFSAGSAGNQQTSSVPIWVPQGLTTVTNWGGVTIGPAQTNVANDSWKVSFPTVPSRDCQQAVIHELDNWSAITVNGTLVSDAPSTIDACQATTSGQSVVAFMDYRGPFSSAGNAFALPPGAGQPYNPPPGAPTPPVTPYNPGPAAPPPSAAPVTPPVGNAATPSPSGPGVAMPPPTGAAPTPSYPGACVAPSPQTQTLTCPTGQLGSIAQTRTATCPDPYANPVWGAWTTTLNTCAPACVAPPSGTGSQTATCPSGQVTSGGATSFTQTQSISYTCPAPTGAYTTAYGPWTPATASACAPKCVAPTPTTGSQTAACPSGQVTSSGATSFTQTESITYSCPSPQGGYATAYGPWTPATTSVCAPKCVAPAPGTNTQTVSCPSGQVTSAGAASFTQSQSVTYSCPAPQGGYATAYGAWSPPASSVCAPKCVAPAPIQQWVACPPGQAVPGPFPANYNGVQQQNNGVCPAPTGPGAYSGWYNTGVVSCAPVCTAPGAWTNTQYQWVNQSSTCPVGETGSITWQAQQASSQTISYSCPQVTGSATQNNGPWGPWTPTGATQNYSDTCRISCVSPDSFVVVLRNDVEQEIRAGDVVKGDELRLISPESGQKRWGRVSVSYRDRSERVLITTARGITLTCSVSAPIGVLVGEAVLAKDLLGHTVVAEMNGHFIADEVVKVKPLGEGEVQLITCENDFFLAGDQSGLYLAHHNKKVGVCVSLDAWLWVRDRRGEHHVQAIDVHQGDEVRTMNPRTGELAWSRVTHAKLGHAECVRVETTQGITLTCSTVAPLGLAEGDSAVAMTLTDHVLGTWAKGVYGQEAVRHVTPMGAAKVRNIEVEEGFFLVGDQAGRFLTHEG